MKSHKSFGCWYFARPILLVASVVALAAGCATNRGTVDIRTSVPANPSSGPAVKFTRVSDNRVFELKPSEPSTPSLKHGEINDKAITSRAIARKRNGFGTAIGDILLPEGRTVEMLVQEALTRAFREGGLRVLSKSEDGYDAAIPLDASIEQFWSWFTPGFWTVDLEFQSKVSIRGSIGPFSSGAVATGYKKNSTMAAGTAAWQQAMNGGLDELINSARELARQASH